VDLGPTLWWICGVLVEASVVILLVRKNFFTTLPVFSSYLAWNLVSDIAIYILRLTYPKQELLLYFLPEIIIDSLFQFAVLVELVWSVLRPLRPSLPKRTTPLIALLIAIAGAIIWPITGIVLPSQVQSNLQFWVHAQQTVSVLRIVIFLGLAGMSQLLAIGWKDRELQIATGLGFYSLINFAVSIVHSHQAYGPQYRALDVVVAASYFCSLLYWIFSFVQKEAPRRDMTPQMQNLLLTLAGSAQSTRAALASSSTRSKNNQEHR
jgi:hypothetical protein